MLITFSGSVGSGKSTTAKQIVKLLEAQAHTVHYVRFRFIGWRFLFGGPARRRPAAKRPAGRSDRTETAPLRTQPVVRLSAARCAGYALRMLVFHLIRRIRMREGVWICDRFFYDSFVHYRRASKRERFYFKLLRAMMPVPELAFLALAGPKIILQRRPHYEHRYIYDLSKQYERIAGEFRHLIPFRTDDPQNMPECLLPHLQAHALLSSEFTSEVE